LFFRNPSNNTFYEAGSGSSNESYAYVCDFTGDGNDDLILAQNWNTPNATYKISVYAYKDNSFVSMYSEFVDYFFQAHLGDFNGDGKVDIMYERRNTTGSIATLSFSQHDFSCADMAFNSNDKISVIDITGSGKTNILFSDEINTEIYTYYSDYQAFSYPFTSFPTKYSKIYYGDFNGDGIADILDTKIVYIGGGEHDVVRVVKFGNGRGVYNSSNNGLDLHYGLVTDLNGVVADLNGDGKDDIIEVIYYSTIGKSILYMYFSKGYVNGNYIYTYKEKRINGDYSNIALWHLGDFNYDGRNDLLLRKSNSDTQPKIIYFNKDEQYEYVKEIEDGLGQKTTISYTPRYLSFISSSANQSRKVFAYLPSKLQTSNGIGNNLTELQFSYRLPFYSVERKSFLGFREFVTKNIEGNITTTDSLYFITDYFYNFPLSKPVREILLPYKKVSRINVYPYTINQIDYSCQTVDLPSTRFVLHNKLIRNQDYLSDTKTETTSTVNSAGRVQTSNTKTYNTSNAPSANWIHSQTNTYTYNTITLNGNQKKTVPAQILTTQQYGTGSIVIADTATYSYYTDNTNNGRLKSVRQGNLDGSITTTYSNYTSTGVYQTKTVSAQDVASRTETFAYDATRRFVIQITNPLNHLATFAYNPKTGNKISETDANGLTTAYTYDRFGRLTQIN
jgi:YD repeat-containing protein